MSISTMAFVGGGNMAAALIGGLIRSGRPASSILVVEPHEAQRERLLRDFGVASLAQADERLAQAATVVWAVKPQVFREAAGPCAAHVGRALQVSVMAGVRSDTVVAATGSAQVVRTMPNTPALIGRGIAGLFARSEVTAAQREQVQALFEPTGQWLWVSREDDLDAVTALSGSGPAYVFYFIEALRRAALEMGFSTADAQKLVLGTFDGAVRLAQASDEDVAVLRQLVTSKGGTTEAAIRVLDDEGVSSALVNAITAAAKRSKELSGR